MSTLTSTLLFTTNLRRRRPLVGQRILICASRFEVNACMSQAKRFLKRLKIITEVSFCRPVFCSIFFRPFPTFSQRCAV